MNFIFAKRLFFGGAMLLPPLVSASPTSNEIEACHQRASGALDFCLRKAGFSENAHCWAETRLVHRACLTEVIESHDPVSRKAREEARRLAVHEKIEEMTKRMQESPLPSDVTGSIGVEPAQ